MSFFVQNRTFWVAPSPILSKITIFGLQISLQKTPLGTQFETKSNNVKQCAILEQVFAQNSKTNNHKNIQKTAHTKYFWQKLNFLSVI